MQLVNRQPLRCFRTGVVIDDLMDDGAIEVIRTEGQRGLGDFLTQHDPIRFDVIEVVEHQPGDGDGLQILQSAWLRKVIHARVFGMEREWDEGLESRSFVLKFTQSAKMINTVLWFFDVSVEHGRVGPQTELMGGAMHIEPYIRVGFVLADLATDIGIKNLCPAARQTPQPGFSHFIEDPADRLFGLFAEPPDFYWGPGFDVNLRPSFVDHADDVEIPIELLLVMQTADDVNFRRTVRLGFQHAVADHFIGERVRLLRSQIRPERTERAAIDADVRRVQMDVGVVVRVVAVLSLANLVGQPAEREQIRFGFQKQTVLERQPLAGRDLLGNVGELGG